MKTNSIAIGLVLFLFHFFDGDATEIFWIVDFIVDGCQYEIYNFHLHLHLLRIEQ